MQTLPKHTEKNKTESLYRDYKNHLPVQSERTDDKPAALYKDHHRREERREEKITGGKNNQNEAVCSGGLGLFAAACR